jgi:eukaryotic-like serine/threonine-protein kinase
LRASHASRPGLAARIASEGRLLALVRHENLVDVLDLGLLSSDGRPYLVLELLEGHDLRAERDRMGVLSVPAALGVAAQILRGLAAIHHNGIVHRDIKLENLFLCGDGRAKILDLGAAEPVSGREREGARGASLATPRTMAPEQFAGKPVDGRADLYALGLVLYELVAGRGPFDDARGVEAVRSAHLFRTPEPPSRFAPQAIPEELDALILRALEKEPDDRFASAEAMAIEIEALSARPRAPTAPSRDDTLPSALFAPEPPREGASADARRWVVSALAIASLAAGIAVGRLLVAPSPVASPASSAAAVR